MVKPEVRYGVTNDASIDGGHGTTTSVQFPRSCFTHLFLSFFLAPFSCLSYPFFTFLPSSTIHTMLPLSLNFNKWLEENGDKLQPPVNNFLLFQGKDTTVMVVGGPNRRTDYHINETEVRVLNSFCGEKEKEIIPLIMTHHHHLLLLLLGMVLSDQRQHDTQSRR